MLAISAQADHKSLLPSTPFPSLDSLCDVSVSWDSTNTGDIIITAYPTGTAPFAYLWNTGETTPTIELSQWGVNYCVTVTDATGCESSACLFNAQNCSVYISENPASGLTAIASGSAPFSYL
ncbi:MAG: hypothetical protein IPM82_01325 [Saprospiraceae bacterium]|nr:hypothetical protein [Saprospiraceae bacterium]